MFALLLDIVTTKTLTTQIETNKIENYSSNRNHDININETNYSLNESRYHLIIIENIQYHIKYQSRHHLIFIETSSTI